jgi:hypothetical protein
MTFITKFQAEQFLREYYISNYVLAKEQETFEEVLEILEGTLDLVDANVVYAYHVFKGNV